MAQKSSRSARLRAGRRKRKLGRVASQLYGRPLAITSEKLQEIVDFFEGCRAGHAYTEDELRALGYLDGHPRGVSIMERDDDEDPGYEFVEGIAVLPVYGVIAHRMNMFMRISGGTSTEMLSAAFDRAVNDDAVKAIVLDVDSPGGSIEGVDELSRQIFEARGKKPIVAVANCMMASAAYYIASAAEEVIAAPSALIGSIGVIVTHVDHSKADAELGLKYSFIYQGKHKVDGNSHEPLNKQSRASTQELVDAAYEDFISAVARNRGVSADVVKEDFGQAKCFLGGRAVDAGLADRVGTFQEIIGQLVERNRAKSTAGIQMVKEKTVDRIKAALMARGLVDADASEATVKAALAAFCAARGVDVPGEVEATVLLLASPAPKAEKAAPRKPARVRAEEVDEDEEEDDLEEEEDKPNCRQNGTRAAMARERKVRADERSRVADIMARGKLLGASEELIQASIDEGDDVGEALVRFTDKGAKLNRPAVNPFGDGGLDIRPDGSPVDGFVADATEALFARVSGFKDASGAQVKLSNGARGLQYARMIDIATKALSLAGVRCEAMDPDDRAKAFLSMGGRYTMRLSAAGGQQTYSTPSDYPNILSAVLGKIKDYALQVNTSTFREWTYQLDSVPDFKPKTIVAHGSSGELDEIRDGDPFPEGKFGEEVSWIAVGTFGRKRGLTPTMIVGDDLQVYTDALQDDIRDHDITLNRLCVDLLIGNPNTPDNNAAFSAAHANQVTAGTGAAPSIAQTDLMRQLMRQQYDVGKNNRMRVGPSIALVGSVQETAAEQVYLPMGDGIYPAVDSNRNPFRGKIRPIVEQMLDDWAYPKGWFLFADPRLVRALVYMYQTGFEGGKLESWYDPDTRCRYTSIEGRFAAAWRNWRGVVRNSGSDANL
jgi:signal peptide peptidase SppA